MRVLGYGATDVGLKRKHNEDFLMLEPELGLYMVCDGMGGHAAGEVASETAGETVRAYLKARRDVIDGYEDSPEDRRQISELLEGAVLEACITVYNMAREGQGRAGMGTTLILLLVVGDKGVMAHVGDSRLYLQRGGYLHQLSEDHNFMSEFKKRGLSEKEAPLGALGNRLTRAVGTQPSVKVDKLIFDILPGDRLLLCSDGISGYFEEKPELNEVLASCGADALPGRLVELALERGGEDNCTALVLEVVSEERTRERDERRSTEVGLRLDVLNHVALFEALDMSDISNVLSHLEMEMCSEGDDVIRQGEAGDSLYIVLEGELAVFRGGVEVARMGAGSHFGEMSLFNQRPRSATVRALSYTRLLVMRRAPFRDLIASHPVLGTTLLWNIGSVLSERFDDFNVVFDSTRVS